MKIFIVVHNLNGGGAEKMMARLANGFINLGDDVTLVLLTGGGVNKAILSERISVVELQARRTMFSFFKLASYIRQENPDKIISALTHVNFVSIIACYFTGNLKKLFVSERNAFSQDRHVNSSLFVRMAYRIVPYFYRKIPNKLLAVSEGVKSDLIKFAKVPAEKIISLPNPVLEDDFCELKPRDAKHPWLINKTTPVIMAVGRLSPQKGFDVLLKAFAGAVKSVNCRLVIYGEGVLKDDLLQLAESLGIEKLVSFPGYFQDVLNEMRHASLFVLSSRFEGSPNVLVEAASTGIPVVSTNCPYGPSEILLDGKIAPLVPVDDPEELTREIIYLLTHVDEKLTARIDSVKRFTITNSALSYKSVLVG